MIRRHGAVLRLFLMAADAVTCLILFAVMSALVLGPDWRIDWVAATDPLEPFRTVTRTPAAACDLSNVHVYAAGSSSVATFV